VSASQCLSLLVQLYGGNSQENMSPENMDSFAEVLKSKTDTRQLKLLLRIVKRLVSWLLNIFKSSCVSFISLVIFWLIFSSQVKKRIKKF